MTREKFLQELRIALQGQIVQVQVNEQLGYYENYIIEESRKGRTEQEVIDSLGSPRLIAKTIIQIYGNTVSQNTQNKQKARSFGNRGRKMVIIICVLLFLLLLVRIGWILLPMIASAFMIALMIYLFDQFFFQYSK